MPLYRAVRLNQLTLPWSKYTASLATTCYDQRPGLLASGEHLLHVSQLTTGRLGSEKARQLVHRPRQQT